MCVNSNAKIDEIGYLIRANGFSMKIEFGSGGYAISITDLKTKVRYVEISYDIIEAVKCVLNKAICSDECKEEKTVPSIPKLKNI